jgi:general nucleoside transport system permease protein
VTSPNPAIDFVRTYLLPRSVLSGLAAIALAFLVGAVLIALAGRDPVAAYLTLFQASLGSANGLAETALRTVPLALCGIGIALAFRAGVFNTGAEGQLFIGGTAAAWVGLQLAGQPQALVLTAMVIGAAIAGAAWSGIAAILKLKFRADELITTIMLNYIAIYLVGYLLHGPLQDPTSPLAQTARLGAEARLPVLLEGSRLNAGIIIAVVVALVAQLYLWRAVDGFRLRAVGENPRAALNAGMNVKRIVWTAFLACGALAGVAGFTEVAGVQRRMIENLSPGYGYTAIIVALLGQTNPLGVLAAAVLFAALQIGSRTMESAVGVPSALTTVIQALVVLFLIGQNALAARRAKVEG